MPDSFKRIYTEDGDRLSGTRKQIYPKPDRGPKRAYHYNPPRKGTRLNRLEVVKLINEMSALYERYYFTGEMICRCLGENDDKPCTAGENGQPKEVIVKASYFRMTSPRTSKYSCGCCAKPRKPKNRKSKKLRKGKPLPLDGQVHGYLTVLKRITKVGWKCECHCGHKCVVKRSYQLLRGTVTACEKCRPWEWKVKGGYEMAAKKKRVMKERAKQLEEEYGGDWGAKTKGSKTKLPRK